MRLHFDLAVTQRLLDHSKAATERSPTCDQLYEGRFRRDGKDADLDNLSADNFPTAEDVDPAKIPPGLWLVGDQGIYLMSNGQPSLRPEVGDSLNIVSHAPEADPRVNPEGWWDAKQAAFGGDDGVVFLELPFAEGLIARGCNGQVCIDLTPAQVAAVVPTRPLPAAPPARRFPSQRAGRAW